MKKTKFERFRISLSRILAAAGFLLLCATKSYWETKNDIIPFTLFFIGMILVAIASLGRMWCSLYIAGYKDKKLITEGPYSICRNPLYFFSMLGLLGIGCATETFTFPAVFTVLFGLYYPSIIRKEESRLLRFFGTEFEEYKKRVPAFFPSRKAFHEPETCIVNPAVYRKHIFSALWFVWIVGILEVIEGLGEIGWFTPPWSLF